MSDIRETSDVPALRAAVAPDYPLAESLQVQTHAQMKAIADPTRNAIAVLLLDRAATTSELAIALKRPKGTVDHHVKVLAAAGLVHVVRTRKVRAMTENYWGRTARTFMFEMTTGEMATPLWFMRTAHDEIARTLGDHVGTGPNDVHDDEHDDGGFSTLRHSRIPLERVKEFRQRLNDLTLEFAEAERGGTVIYGLLAVLYPSDRPVLPEPRVSTTAGGVER